MPEEFSVHLWKRDSAKKLCLIAEWCVGAGKTIRNRKDAQKWAKRKGILKGVLHLSDVYECDVSIDAADLWVSYDDEVTATDVIDAGRQEAKLSKEAPPCVIADKLEEEGHFLASAVRAALNV